MIRARRLLSPILALVMACAPTLEAAPAAIGRLAPSRRAGQPPRPIRLQAPAAAAAARARALPAPSARRASPLRELRAIAASQSPARAAARRFDGLGDGPRTFEPAPVAGAHAGAGARLLSAAGDDFPRRTEPASRAVKAKSFLKGLNDSTRAGSPAEVWFERAAGLGTLAALALPIAWGIVPVHYLAFSFPVAMVAPTLAIGPIVLWRLIRFLRHRQPSGKPQGPPPSRTAKAGLLGFALGFAVGAAPLPLTGPLLERGARIVAADKDIRYVRGGALRDEIVSLLSNNAEGRDILDHLKDRGGRLRLPIFVVSDQPGLLGANMPFADAIFISKDLVTSRGWKVEDFVRSPALQRQFAREMQNHFAHELRHSNQFLRSTWYPEQFPVLENLESEYEAFLTQHFYIHEQLRADPLARLSNEDLGAYIAALPGLDYFLQVVDHEKVYGDKTHSDHPYYRSYLDRKRAAWPAHQIEAYELLARRYERLTPAKHRTAAIYRLKALTARARLAPPASPERNALLAQARELAKNHGLAAPSLEEPPASTGK